VFANAPEGDAGQEFWMPDRLTPFFRWRHLCRYRLLSVDIDVDIPGLVAGLENPARVVIGRVKTGVFFVGRLPIERGLLGAPRSSCA
jgi:hypothetical protein